MSHTLREDPYYSRQDDRWEGAPRVDPVVWRGKPGPLSAEQLEAFERLGFLSIAEFFSTEETQVLRRETEALAAKSDEPRDDIITEPGSRIVRSVFRVHKKNDLLAQFCHDSRLVSMVEQILGSEVYVHQSRVNFKRPFVGKEFFWHSDFETWHIEDGMPRMRALSVSINLTDNHEFNGPLMVIRGSHKVYIRTVGKTPENHYKDSLRKQEIGVPDLEALKMLVDKGGIEAPKGPAGSITLFDCNIMHGSVANLSPNARVNLFVVYNSIRNTLRDPYGSMRPRPEFLAERQVEPIKSM